MGENGSRLASAVETEPGEQEETQQRRFPAAGRGLLALLAGGGHPSPITMGLTEPTRGAAAARPRSLRQPQPLAKLEPTS